MEPFKKIVMLGTQKEYGSHGQLVNAPVYCKIIMTEEEKGLCLSITGVVGPKSNGDCIGSCGQIYDSLNIDSPGIGWDEEKIKKFVAIWKEWNLNDVNAATPAMKAAGWGQLVNKEIFRYFFVRTDEAHKELEKLGALILDNAIQGDMATPLDDRQKRLLKSKRWVDIIDYTQPKAPEFMEPNIDLQTNKPKIERMTLGWVYNKEHPDGLLGRELDGFKYGHAWYFHEIPADVIEWLKALPNATMEPAWV